MRLSILFLISFIFSAPLHALELDFGKIGKGVGNLVSKSKDLKEVDEPQEVEIGKGVASNLLGAVSLVNNPAVQGYVNSVGRWLANQTERPDLKWHFGVLDSPNVNAFATPGGYIFITKGLLDKTNNEAELAGVLAHEISHVLKKHHLNAIQKGAKSGMLADMAKIATENNKHGELLSHVIDGSMDIYARGLDKDDEYEADRMGVVIAARAGYDPYGLPAVLQTLEAMNPQDNNLTLMFKTHPSPTSRLTTLDKLMTPALESFATHPQLQERFEKIKKN
jgi:predicted Zn-dependent protease